MGQYRKTRAITASIIDYLRQELLTDWSNVNIERIFSRVYGLSLPVLSVRVSTTIHNKAEIGNTATIRNPQVLIDVFSKSESQKEDLTDYLVTKLKVGIPFYNYTVVNGQITNKIEDGRIRVTSINCAPVDLGIDKDKLSVYDRYRMLITLKISLSKMEN